MSALTILTILLLVTQCQYALTLKDHTSAPVSRALPLDLMELHVLVCGQRLEETCPSLVIYIRVSKPFCPIILYNKAG